MNDNVLTVIEFEQYADAQKFINRHKCTCLSFLIATKSPHGYYIECPDCGTSVNDTVITNKQAALAEQNERIGAREFFDKLSTEQALKDLGF
jgi:hypothetical protein